MMLRDARGQVHDLGPRRTLCVSSMKIAAGYGEEATGRWQTMSNLFDRPERPVSRSKPKVAYEDRTSAERQRRYRALHRAEVNARSSARRRLARAVARASA